MAPALDEPLPGVGPTPITGLTVVFDDHCSFCWWCTGWLERQALHVPMRFVPSHGPEAEERWGGEAWLGWDLAVVADDGRAWFGPSAFVVCLWATVAHRGLARTLALPGASVTARVFFGTVSRNRAIIGRFRGGPDAARCDALAAAAARSHGLGPSCPTTGWSVPGGLAGSDASMRPR